MGLPGMFDLGPRSIPVLRDGNEVLAGRNFVVRDGPIEIVGPPIFDIPIGHMSPLPFDKTVRDGLGREIGKLEGGIIGPHTLLRW